MGDKWLSELIQFLKENRVEYYKTKDVELKFAPAAFYETQNVAKIESESDNKTDKELFENDLFYSAR